MSLANLLQKAGGLRGIAASAAIAWGTSQANRIAEEAQEAAQAAHEALQQITETLTERQAELERIDAERESILSEMRRQATKFVVAEVREGKYDNTVAARAVELGWSEPQPPEPDLNHVRTGNGWRDESVAAQAAERGWDEPLEVRAADILPAARKIDG